MTLTSMADIFLSYAREDRECARLLARELTERGWSVWWDRQLSVGEEFSRIIERELEAARVVVVLWSRYSVASDWVLNEAAEAASRRVLIPVRIEEVRVPLEFRRLQTADLLDWRDRLAGPEFDVLLLSIGEFLGQVAHAERRTARVAEPLTPKQTAPAAKTPTVVPQVNVDRTGDTRAPQEPSSERTQVFISYSHRDIRWLRRLQVHLRPLERHSLIRRWDDTVLQAGDDWRREIRDAIARTKVAVLLVSADFIASDFVYTNELPPLLAAAQADGAVVLPIVVSACNFEHIQELSRFQAFNPPSKPLDGMTRPRQERIFADVATRVGSILSESTAG
jgi:hypothetical protein